MSKNPILIITGPSGVGKTTIAQELLVLDKRLVKVITYTSRAKRAGEVDDVDYHFISKAEFEAKIERGEFLEWAVNYDNYYGNCQADLEKIWAENKIVLFVIDIKGALSYKQKMPQSIVVFLKPDSIENLLSRLKSRGKIAEADFQERTKVINQELSFVDQCDFVIINQENQISEAVEELREIINKKFV